MDGGMKGGERKRDSRGMGVDTGTAMSSLCVFTLNIARTQMACHNIVSPFLSVSIHLSISPSRSSSPPPFVSSFNIKQCVECRLQADGR